MKVKNEVSSKSKWNTDYRRLDLNPCPLVLEATTQSSAQKWCGKIGLFFKCLVTKVFYRINLNVW